MSVLNLLRPQVFVAFIFNNQPLAESYIDELEGKLEYINIHLEDVVQDEVERGSPLGK